jgi:hypothetical protein
MKIPIKPTAPSSPKKPEKEYIRLVNKVIRIDNGDTLESIIEQAGEHVDKMKFKTERGYYDSYDYEFSGDVEELVVLTQGNFEAEMSRYKIGMEKYKEKLEKYNNLMTKYIKDKEEYDGWKAEQDKLKELSLLEKLKRKYGK